MVNEYATDLKRVSAGAVAAQAQSVVPRVARLVRCTPGDRRKASMLDALGTSLEAHPPLLAAVRSDGELCALLDWALELAAADDESYTNDLCTAQMATAQAKFGRYCAPFWRTLEARGVQHLQPRQLATVLHRAATLPGAAANAQVPTSELQVALMAALKESICGMDAQQVANSIYACGKLAARPDDDLQDAMSAAAVAASPRMTPQALANTLWAWATLDLRPDDELQAALLSRALRVAPDMDAQTVANVLWALAKLDMELSGSLQAALLSRGQAVAADMTPQDVANTLWALAKLDIELTGELQAALLGRAEHVAPDMKPQKWQTLCGRWPSSISSSPARCRRRCSVARRQWRQRWPHRTWQTSLWALAKLRTPPPEHVCAALLQAAERESARMNSQDVANTVWAVAELQLRVGEAPRAALCAALEREAPLMIPEGVHMTRSALQRLHWPVSEAVRAALRLEDGACEGRRAVTGKQT